jgi:hypothetical protein
VDRKLASPAETARKGIIPLVVWTIWWTKP